MILVHLVLIQQCLLSDRHCADVKGAGTRKKAYKKFVSAGGCYHEQTKLI